MPDVRSDTDFEKSDVPPRLLAALAAGLAASIALVLIGLAIAFPHALGPSPRGPLKALPPAPRLQTDPAVDLARYREEEARKLAAKRGSGVSIERAMREVATEGWSDSQ